MVRKEMYTNQVRMRVTEMPIFSPIAVHTPKSFHSIKCLKRFMLRIYTNSMAATRLDDRVTVF